MINFLKTTKGKMIVLIVFILLIAAAVCALLFSDTEKGYRNISISEIFGIVMTENDGKTYEAYKSMRLGDGYILTTDSDSYARMILDDSKYMKLEQLSCAVFERLGNDKDHKTAIRLENGVLTSEIASPLNDDEDFVVSTPNAVLAVRGTFFKTEVTTDDEGTAYTNVYTFGGNVACKRIMPDETVVDEEIDIKAGYKARIRMDENVTEYIEKSADGGSDNVDPIEMSDLTDDDLVDIYNASMRGHEMYLTSSELREEIEKRGIFTGDPQTVYEENVTETSAEEEDNSHIYLTDGSSITITSTGYTIGDSDDELPCTDDYVISQMDSSTPVNALITVESGTHNITLDGINIVSEGNGIMVSDNAAVTLDGGAVTNTIASDTGGIYNEGTLVVNSGKYKIDLSDAFTLGINNVGVFTINGGTFDISGGAGGIAVPAGSFTINSGTVNVHSPSDAVWTHKGASLIINGGNVISSGDSKGIYNEGAVKITGGSIGFSGGSGDHDEDINTYFGENFIVTGGSLLASDNYVVGSITNEAGEELECVVYSTFPGQADRTFMRSDGIAYVYNLAEADKASDGSYYLWKPIENS